MSVLVPLVLLLPRLPILLLSSTSSRLQLLKRLRQTNAQSNANFCPSSKNMFMSIGNKLPYTFLKPCFKF